MADDSTAPDFDLAAASDFVAAAGLVVDEISGEIVRGHLELGPEHHTPWGTVNGGVYTTTVESAATIGASAAVAGRGQCVIGLHHATDLLRPCTEGHADVVAEAVHQGRTQQLWVVTIRDEHGRALARGQVRLQNVDRNGDSD